MNEENSPVFDEARNCIRHYSVGFLKKEGDLDVDNCGSGTFVLVGDQRCILSAAHVVEALPNTGPIGIVRFSPYQSALQKFTFEGNLCKKIILRGKAFGCDEPDLALLVLPYNVAGTVAAQSSFYNLTLRRDGALRGIFSEKNNDGYMHCAVGVIHELTTERYELQTAGRIKTIYALCDLGKVLNYRHSNEYDFIDFEPKHEEGYQAPQNYQGMSGGGLWRIFVKLDASNKPTVSDIFLFGVVFFQSDLVAGKRVLTCHGPQSIYGQLLSNS